VNSYVVQRSSDGVYQAVDGYTSEPHKAHRFMSRSAALEFIALSPSSVADQWRVAILPGTRPLLSIPQEREA
jgi:hypothetical protein